MKKYILLGLIMLVFYIGTSHAMEKKLMIPDDSLRIRVIPNSNSDYDQEVKKKVKNKVQITMYNLLKESKTVTEAREIVENHLDIVDNEVKEILLTENYKDNYDINYGYNYFPEKTYKGVTYNEWYYESLVVKLGKGEGDNWWCVLYPPLCLIEEDDTEYKSLVKEILNRYF